ncbi:hypothetical protein HU830_03910 [Lactobacillus sp. DCY120]|uniref:Uncharacterized protein n=1 Tax=Bombilactobacillus apium TaxID=2675299 RepID=A0A850R656_9LACO|nr:hypothetical protein [Bombilactobacillus apium]NVY96317.1 hypothetical protein [Bombilactobacillus apium]
MAKKDDNQLAPTNWPILTKNNQALNVGTVQTIYQGQTPVLKYDPKNLDYPVSLPVDTLQVKLTAFSATKLGAYQTDSSLYFARWASVIVNYSPSN